MRTVWSFLAGIVALASLAVAVAAAPEPAPPTAPAPPAHPLAQSAQLAADASEADDSVAIRIRYVTNQKPVDSTGVTVSVNGKKVPVTQRADGVVLLPAKDLRGSAEHTLDIIVPHDGIREILTGKLVLPPASSSSGLLGGHQQIAWWILNVVVVLIAAIALSRRKA